MDLILGQPQRIAERLSIEALADRIRTDVGLAQRTTGLRAALAEGGREGRYRELKAQMPAVVPRWRLRRGPLPRALRLDIIMACMGLTSTKVVST